jgi:enoyl-CoA hydratase/carnithine racemase
VEPIEHFKHILYAVEDRVARITLNRPEKLNALFFGPDSNRDELVRAFARADADDRVGAILLSGAGRSFCAGADLTIVQPRATSYEEQRFFEESARFLRAIRNVSKPTIAAVHGVCVGAGLGLMAQCDLIVAADDARFGLVEGPRGLPGATEIVPLIGPSWAKFMILTGELLDAAWAERIGLIMLAVAASQLAEATFELARRIAHTPAKSTQLNKLSINSMIDAGGLQQAMNAGHTHDALTAAMSKFATAPDGRLVRDILQAEGVAGLRTAFAQPPWLSTFARPPRRE